MSVIVVTGASRGLGAGLTRAFVDAGHAVAACARTRPGVGDLRAAVDVTDRAAVFGFCAEVATELGDIDLWVSNAGVLEPIAPVRDLDPSEFRDALEVNLFGVLHCMQAYLAHRRPLGGGCLVAISSGAARRGYPAWGAYCAAKAGVDRLSEVVAEEEAGTGLRVHAVSPGLVDTGMQALIRATPADVFPPVDRFLAAKAEGRFNSPAHVARHLLDLAFGDPNPDVLVRIPDEWSAVEQ